MSIQNLSGQTLGQYEVRERLGVGGMGAVYRGYQSALKRAVAIKILPWNLAEQEDYITRFTREAEIAAALEHPNIVPIYDYGTENGVSYVVMRLLTGGSLGQRLALREEEEQPLPSPGEAAKLLEQLASALDYAHSQGVIHRDIKPSNIMFDNHGTAYLADFGIAKLMHQNTGMTGGSVLVGTPSFMAPEQWRSEELTAAADQYSAGAVIYTVITGHLPFDASTPYGLMHKHLNEMPTPPQLLRADMPEEIAVVLERSLAKDPATRFETMTAFSQAFDAAISGKEGEETGFFSVQFDDASISDALAIDNDTITDLPQPNKPKTDTNQPKPESPSSRLKDEGTQPIPGERTPLATLSPEAPSNNVISAATQTGTETMPVGVMQPPHRSNMMMWVVLLVALLGVGLAALSLLSAQRNEALQALQATEIVLQVAQTALAGEQIALSETAQAILDAPTATATITPTFTFTPSQTPTSTFTPTDTPSPTPATPIVEAMRDEVAALSGPGFAYPVLVTLQANDQLEITGISVDGAWFQVLLLDGSFGWVAASSTLVNAAGDLTTLPIVPPPTNTPTPTLTPSPSYTPSVRPTHTRQPSDTPTRTPTETDRPTARPTRTPSPEPTETNTPRPMRTLSRTPDSAAGEADTEAVNCPDALPSRLRVGEDGAVLADDGRVVSIREEASLTASAVGRLEAGDTFEVLEGPLCNDVAWYRVSGGVPLVEGWIIEGTDEYFVEPE